MTKKLKYLIIGILLFLPIKTKALSGNYSLSCGSNSLKVGATTNCYVTGSFDTNIVAAEVTIGSSSNITISNINTGAMGLQFGNKAVNSPMGLEGSVAANTNATFISFTVKLNSESSNSYVSSSLNSITDTNYDSIDKGSRTYNISVKKEEPKTEPTTKPETPDINKVPVEKKETSTETKKEEEEKKKQDAEQNKQEVTTAKTLDTKETVGATKTTNAKEPKSSNKSSNDILIFIATIVAVVLFVVVVGYTVYIKINEKNKKA